MSIPIKFKCDHELDCLLFQPKICGNWRSGSGLDRLFAVNYMLEYLFPLMTVHTSQFP